MKILPRRLDLRELVQDNNIFLFGPRATGKSLWIRHSLPKAKIFDLLDSDVYDRFLRRPKQLSEEIGPREDLVVIDEIQKLPRLLDEVHRLIEERNIRFLLTGSSARKLKREGANMLAGRAWQASFFPFVSAEIPDFSLPRFLSFGGLPRVHLSAKPMEELKAYVRLYVQEEVKNEALTRKIENFVRFLDVMAAANGQEINYQSLAGDSGVPPRTIENYLEILKDTLLGFELLPFTCTSLRKAVSRSKFYFFDIGVPNFIAGKIPVNEGGVGFGEAFEHWIVLEVRAFLSLARLDLPLYYWRTTLKDEVDLIIGRDLAVEIKGTTQVQEKHLKGLRKLRDEGRVKRYAIVSRDPVPRCIDGIHVWPYQHFLDRLWSGKLFPGNNACSRPIVP